MLHTSDCKWYWLVKLIFVKLGSLGLGLPEVFGRLAQLVEQLTLNQRVKGSSPLSPSNLFNNLREICHFSIGRFVISDHKTGLSESRDPLIIGQIISGS